MSTLDFHWMRRAPFSDMMELGKTLESMLTFDAQRLVMWLTIAHVFNQRAQAELANKNVFDLVRLREDLAIVIQALQMTQDSLYNYTVGPDHQSIADIEYIGNLIQDLAEYDALPAELSDMSLEDLLAYVERTSNCVARALTVAVELRDRWLPKPAGYGSKLWGWVIKRKRR